MPLRLLALNPPGRATPLSSAIAKEAVKPRTSLPGRGGGIASRAESNLFSKRLSFISEMPMRFAISARGMRAVTRSTKRACSALVGTQVFGFAIASAAQILEVSSNSSGNCEKDLMQPSYQTCQTRHGVRHRLSFLASEKSVVFSSPRSSWPVSSALARRGASVR